MQGERAIVRKNDYFCNMLDFKFNIKHFLLLFFVSACLLYLTRSWLMSLGIMMLLVLTDRLIVMYGKKRGNGKDND